MGIHCHPVVGYIMVLLIVVLVFIVLDLDLDRPRRGIVKVSQQSLLDLQAQMR